MRLADLESDLDRRLARLPHPQAPATLLPRILAAARKAALGPWFRQPWACWPRACQAVSLAVLLAGAGLLAVALEGLGAGPIRLPEAGADGRIAVTAQLVRLLWRAVLEPALVYLATLTGAMCLAVALFCAALTRLLQGGSIRR